MGFRFDMQGKTTKQQIIVSKRDEEDKRLRNQEKEHVEKAMSDNSSILLAIDKDTCPKYDNIIYKNQCQSCERYLSFELYEAQPCIKCKLL